jgi:hypothetical protein
MPRPPKQGRHVRAHGGREHLRRRRSRGEDVTDPVYRTCGARSISGPAVSCHTKLTSESAIVDW